MTNKQQTTVEWLFTMLNNPNRNQEFANKLLQKAKEMEKEQIEDAIDYFKKRPYTDIEPEQYYNEKYEGGNK